jgi:hypothetical protein
MPISNERPSPFSRKPPFRRPSYDSAAAPKPHVSEDTLKTATLQVERKFYVLVLKENVRGRFLRITEEVGGRRDSIMIPASGLEDFAKAFGEMLSASTIPAPVGSHTS